MYLLSRFVRDRSGATAIEYALIASIVSIVIFGSLVFVGTSLNVKFGSVASGVR
ncbi:Flp/Fap pilin component [Variibacter gotjawalensis]|uniref:Flp/Fap pilin component n=1 Tax=Variibacter gotjawalensis TaxID=1333996 RepID=A0A0S3PPD9_9BRAD|nr:Flp family type IVb pilin [Variibacter gotjawalensis]NIK48111.1 pilus assembly protein Flp/PilA [Variibacter gotjawalensis]RZS49987.1 pilus assembly protein Flp/PilA [Variibacter gotjawalensis]BAT57814.1 Flp/Fap pilin component [Variibacter gotjawalensis]